MRSLIREVVLWHPAPGVRRAVVLTVVIIGAAFVLSRSAFTIDGPALTDGHAMLSLDMAMAGAWCGAPSSFSSTVRIPMVLRNRMARRHQSLRALAVEQAGSLEAYCRSIDTPFVNSENSLMVVESAILRAFPELSLSQLGHALLVLKLACLAAFVLLLMDLGSSIMLGGATFLCGLMLLQSMPDYAYSNYPFFFTLVLAAVAAYGFAAKHQWTARVAGLVCFGTAVGVMSAFIANMRTSYLPIALLCFACAVADEFRGRGRNVPIGRRARRGAALVMCFAIGYLGFQYGAITRQLPSEGRFNASHPFGHPLVLALAVPENAFSSQQGIRWADEVGPQIAARIDPGVPFLGPRYNAALLDYYKSLWRDHAREMLALYVTKFSLFGSDMLGVLRDSPGLAGWGVMVLLTPLSWWPSGLWLLGFYALLTAGAYVAYLKHGRPEALVFALLSMAACLVHAEAGIIFSIFVKQYHNFAAFYALFLSLLGVQVLANVVSHRLCRVPALPRSGR